MCSLSDGLVVEICSSCFLIDWWGNYYYYFFNPSFRLEFDGTRLKSQYMGGGGREST